jgi:hypothetical protein
MVHEWMNAENLSERLEILVFLLQVDLVKNNVDYELPEDFKYLQFDSNNIEHIKKAKELHNYLYVEAGRLLDEMTGKNYVTTSHKIPNPYDKETVE